MYFYVPLYLPCIKIHFDKTFKKKFRIYHRHVPSINIKTMDQRSHSSLRESTFVELHKMLMATFPKFFFQQKFVFFKLQLKIMIIYYFKNK